MLIKKRSLGVSFFLNAKQNRFFKKLARNQTRWGLFPDVLGVDSKDVVPQQRRPYTLPTSP